MPIEVRTPDLIMTLLLIPVWVWLLSNRRIASSSKRPTMIAKVSIAAVIGLVTLVACAMVSRYSMFLVWAFTLGCIASALWGSKNFREILVFGVLAALAFEFWWGPRLRGLERIARERHRQVIEQGHDDLSDWRGTSSPD